VTRANIGDAQYCNNHLNFIFRPKKTVMHLNKKGEYRRWCSYLSGDPNSRGAVVDSPGCCILLASAPEGGSAMDCLDRCRSAAEAVRKMYTNL
jgi:hypothetical protein